MPVKALNIVPQEAYQQYRQTCVQLKKDVEEYVKRYAGGAQADDVIECLKYLRQIRETLAGFAAVPGILGAARDFERAQSYDFEGEYLKLRGLLIATVNSASAQLTAAVPLFDEVVDGVPAWISFNASQAATLVTNLSAIDAQIS